jgi:hypothetical protein
MFARRPGRHCARPTISIDPSLATTAEPESIEDVDPGFVRGTEPELAARHSAAKPQPSQIKERIATSFSVSPTIYGRAEDQNSAIGAPRTGSSLKKL